MNSRSEINENYEPLKISSTEVNFYNSLLRLVVHDISTPMSVSMVVLKRLQNKFGDQDQNADFEKLAKANLAIVGILEQVRHFLSVTSGKIEMSLVDCSMHELLQATLDLQDELLQQKNLKLQILSGTDELKVRVEPSLFKSVVLSNLLNNAIKFSHMGGRIDVSYGLNSQHEAFVRVVDYGVGIPDDLLPKLFDPTFPTHRKGTHGEEGVGFGLPLVKLFLGYMKGNITVTSQKSDQGPRTCFEVRIPVAIN